MAKNWNTAFPENVDTAIDSHIFTDRLIMLGTAQLLQSRGLLPAAAFKKFAVTSVCRCWVPELKTSVGARLNDKLRGVGEAIGKGHLQEFIIVISTNESDSDDAQEVFTWSIVYDGNDTQCSFKCGTQALASLKYTGMENIKAQTIGLLLRIRKLCRSVLSPLPPSAYATLRVTYNNKTPTGYQAPGFYRSTSLYILDPKARAMNVDGIATPYHKAFLSVQSAFLDDEEVGERRLNESFASMDQSSILGNSFSNESFEAIETPRNKPTILIGKKISRRSPEELQPGSKVGKTRGKKADAAPPKNNKPPTPGRSHKLDQATPSKD